MRTYLVTGGAGFIGSNYIHYMFRKYDNEIRIINALPSFVMRLTI